MCLATSAGCCKSSGKGFVTVLRASLLEQEPVVEQRKPRGTSEPVRGPVECGERGC